MTKKQIKTILDTLTADSDKVTFSINGTEKIKVPITITNEEFVKIFEKRLDKLS